MLSRYCSDSLFTASLLCAPVLICASHSAHAQRGLYPPRVVTANLQVKIVGNTPKASVDISWSVCRNAKTYIVYRNGSQIATGITDLKITDNSVSEGQTYSYTVASSDKNLRSNPSRPAYVTIPLLSQQGPAPIPPTNLRTKGVWNSGPTTMLLWDPAPGAIKYRVYQYDMLIGETNSTNFTIPTNLWRDGLTCTVTTIRGDGKESIPSNIVLGIGGQDPVNRPAWPPGPPQTPSGVTVVPEWNNNAPRNRIYWKGHRDNWFYNIYRDGNLIATGVWQLHYLDTTVSPNQNSTYTVSGANYNWTTYRESQISQSISAKSMSGPVVLPSASPINITNIVTNDDSATIYFSGVPGAVDYRISSPASPGIWKYSGGALRIEANGLTPGVAKTFVVEALDKLGPYQKIDGALGPGGSHGDGTIVEHINGQGDPSNVPNVLEKSNPFQVTAQSRTLTGSQVFFDTFRNFNPLVQVPVDQRIVSAYGFGGSGNDPNNTVVREWQNDRWIIRNYMGDMNMSRNFVMSNHFMDTLYDGNTVFASGPLHNNDATLMMQPKATADFTGGRVLHITFEVDAHFSGRRWIDVIVADSREPLIKPNDVFFQNLPVPSGRIFRYDQFPDHSLIITGTGQAGGGKMSQSVIGLGGRMGWNNPLLNGTMGDIDRRHRFDLYLSQTQFKLYEEGIPMGSGNLPAPLSFPLDQVAIYFLHQVYHTWLEHVEDLITYNPGETFWINHRPFADERHWDNMGFEVVNSFPG